MGLERNRIAQAVCPTGFPASGLSPFEDAALISLEMGIFILKGHQSTNISPGISPKPTI